MSATALKKRLREDLKSAMLEKRSDEVALLRKLIAALDNAEAVPTEGYRPRALGDASAEVVRRELDGRAVEALLTEEVESRLAAAADYERLGRAEEAARLRDEAALAARYTAP
jgi:uncharacterized protein YqeY